MTDMAEGQREALTIEGDGLASARMDLNRHIQALVNKVIALKAIGGTVSMTISIEMIQMDDGILGYRWVPDIRHEVKSVMKFEERSKGECATGLSYRIGKDMDGSVYIEREPEDEHQISMEEVEPDEVYGVR